MLQPDFILATRHFQKFGTFTALREKYYNVQMKFLRNILRYFISTELFYAAVN